MSDETAAVLAISAAVALYALGMGAIAFALCKGQAAMVDQVHRLRWLLCPVRQRLQLPGGP